MTQVTADLAVSLDGYAAGPHQSAELPFGEGVDDRLHRWMFEAADENAAELGAMNGAGAYVMGRNMFGPGRGAWDLDWTGWWGPEPPYQAPVFVLTHHQREPLALDGTTFHFVTDGIQAALQQATVAAGAGRVAVAGDAATVTQYLSAGLLDELSCTSHQCCSATASDCSTASVLGTCSRWATAAPRSCSTSPTGPPERASECPSAGGSGSGPNERCRS